MPFDLSTAKPVFDLSTAKPVGGEDKFTPGESIGGDLKETGKRMGAAVEGVGETGLQLLTGAGSSVVGGIAGLGRTAGGLVSGESFDEATEKGAKVSEKIREKGTYQPKSTGGKELSALLTAPVEIAGRVAGAGLEKAGGLVGPKTAAAGQTIGEAAPEAAAAIVGGRAALKKAPAPVPVAGKDYSPLREMTTEQRARFDEMKSQGVEPTLGNVTREPGQVRFEQQTQHTEAGRPLDQRAKEQDASLLASVEKLKGGADAKSAVDTGRSVRGALEEKAAKEKKKVDAAYDKARSSGETKEQIDTTSLNEYFAKTEPDSIAVPELKAMRASFDELRKKNEEGTISIDDLENLRRKANRFKQKDGSVKAYMDDIVKGIDTMTEGKGGDLYKAARKARTDWGTEFEEHGGTADILKKDSRTDYKTAHEDVFRKAVIGGSIQELTQVLDSLRGVRDGTLADLEAGKKLTHRGDGVTYWKENGKFYSNENGAKKQIPDQHPEDMFHADDQFGFEVHEASPQAGQAIRDLQTRTVEHLIEAATKNAKGDRINFSPAALKKAMADIGVERLDLLLGRDAVNSLQKTARNAENVKTAPVRVGGSDTAVNVRTMAERVMKDHADHLISGVLPNWANRILQSVRNKAAERAGRLKVDQAVSESLAPHRASMADIAEKAREEKSKNRQFAMKSGAKKAAGLVPATMKPQDEAADR